MTGYCLRNERINAVCGELGVEIGLLCTINQCGKKWKLECPNHIHIDADCSAFLGDAHDRSHTHMARLTFAGVCNGNFFSFSGTDE